MQPTKQENYNGWTNYATWRVHLEIFDGINFVKEDFVPNEAKFTMADLANHLKQVAEDAITEHGEIKQGLALSYADAFLDQVNFYEIAEAVAETCPDLLN